MWGKRRIKKVLLITPPYHAGVVESAGTWLPLGLVYIAGSLKQAGYDVEIYDAMSLFHTHSHVIRKIETERPDVVATGAFTAAVPDAVKLLQAAKLVDPSIITIIGNVHPTFMYKQMLESHTCIDFVIRGEAEHTIVELLECLNNNADPEKVKGIAFRIDDSIKVTYPRALVSDIDTLNPAWELLNWSDYHYFPEKDSTLAIVSSSRGCMHQCSFCSQQLFWRKRWRARSPQSFVKEIEMLSKNYGVNVVMLSDEYPTADRDRWIKILNLLIEKQLNMKLLLETRVDDIVRDQDIMELYVKAGVSHIYVGVESGDDRALDLFKKEIRVKQSKQAIDIINQADLISETSLVLGMPYETQETINKALEMAEYYNPDMAFFLSIAPWPYSDIYPSLKPYINVYDYSKYNLVEPVVKPVAMELDELESALINATREFYRNKMRQLKNMSEHKRKFMITLMKIIMNNSYIGTKLRAMMKDSEHIKKMAYMVK